MHVSSIFLRLLSPPPQFSVNCLFRGSVSVIARKSHSYVYFSVFSPVAGAP